LLKILKATDTLKSSFCFLSAHKKNEGKSDAKCQAKTRKKERCTRDVCADSKKYCTLHKNKDELEEQKVTLIEINDDPCLFIEESSGFVFDENYKIVQKAIEYEAGAGVDDGEFMDRDAFSAEDKKKAKIIEAVVTKQRKEEKEKKKKQKKAKKESDSEKEDDDDEKKEPEDEVPEDEPEPEVEDEEKPQPSEDKKKEKEETKSVPETNDEKIVKEKKKKKKIIIEEKESCTYCEKVFDKEDMKEHMEMCQKKREP